MITPGMQRNYQKYGSLLSLSIFNDIRVASLEFGYRIAVFSVSDAGLRSLIVGVGLFDKSDCICDLLRCFFELHGKAPASLITTDSELMMKAVKKLKQEGKFAFDHVLNSVRALNRVTDSPLK